MSVCVYDDAGVRYTVGTPAYEAMMGQPLVTEHRQTFSFPFGDAELVQMGFKDVYIVYGDMALYERKRLHFEMHNDKHLVELHFTLAGDGVIFNNETGSSYEFRANHHHLHYTSQFNGTGEYLQNAHYKFFELHFTGSYFYELTRDSTPGLIDFADKVVNINPAELSRESLPISFAMHQCIREIMNCRFTGGLKLMFLQSKCIELLTLQAQMYEEVHASGRGAVCKTGQDRDRILFARDYLLQHTVTPPSLPELARLAGLNEFKLKRGFKEVFNTTVFGYLNDHRLIQARELLLAGNMPIKEVADELGYSSVPHFSNAFRKKFGISPGKVRK